MVRVGLTFRVLVIHRSQGAFAVGGYHHDMAVRELRFARLRVMYTVEGRCWPGKEEYCKKPYQGLSA